jgi:hypothetical protein
MSNKTDYDAVDYDSHRDNHQAPSSKKKSSMASKHSRYFAVDPGYDKKYYENEWSNVLVVILVFIIFYMFNVFYWWGLTAFGTAYPEPAKWYSVCCFAATIIWGVGMIFSGYRANHKLYRLEYYLEKINDEEQKIRERELREAHKRDQEEKIAQDRAKQQAATAGETKNGHLHTQNSEEQKFDDMRDNDSEEHHSILLADNRQ